MHETPSQPSATTELENVDRQDLTIYNSFAKEPLTPLTKALLITSLGLLLLSSIFVGLFAGLWHKVKVEHGHHGSDSTSTSISLTSTAIQTKTTTPITVSTSSSRTTITVEPTTPSTLPQKHDICLTTQCIVLSGSILSSLDLSQDPCENFYDFATKEWVRNNPLFSNEVAFGTVAALEKKNKQVVQMMVESSNVAFQSPYDIEVFRKLRNFYESCMNEETLNEMGSIPLLEIVQTLRAIYQKSTNEGSPDLTSALVYLHTYGIETFFSFKIMGDVGEDSNHKVLWINQASLGLPVKHFYEEDHVLRMYQSTLEILVASLIMDESQIKAEHSTSMFTDNEDSEVWPPWPWPPWGGDGDGEDGDGEGKGPVNPTHKARKVAKQIIELEKRLALIGLEFESPIQDPIASYNVMPVSALSVLLPQIDFPTYFSAFTPHAPPKKVIVTHPSYLTSLAQVLDDLENVDLETYLVIRAGLVLSQNLGTNTKEWRALRKLLDFTTASQRDSIEDRSTFCVSKLVETFGFAVGRFFVNKTFTTNSEHASVKIINGIISSFKKSFLKLDWMDENTAIAAIKKADTIKVMIGYPESPNTLDPASIAQYYEDVDPDPIQFFLNVINAEKYSQLRQWRELNRYRIPGTWDVYPSSINAYFDPASNEIFFPAGIFHSPFFQLQWPSYISYGAFGHVVAHELTHAFDSLGSVYNQAGKLEKWWSNNTNNRFGLKQNCLAKQFSAYTIDNPNGTKIHLNGNLSLVENIGDAGLVQAFRAWKKQFQSSLESGNEKLLPGLNFTREQLFFISYARMFAVSIRPDEAVRRVHFDSQSPARYRVEGTVYNIPEFGSAFNCSKTSKLNPPVEGRCTIW